MDITEPNKNSKQMFIWVLLWALMVSLCFIGLMQYKAEPGTQSQPPKVAPTANEPHSSLNNQLLVFLHPQCACSFATLNELKRLMHSINDTPTLTIYFADIMPIAELKTHGLWELATSISSAHVTIDTDNQRIDTFDQHVSGNILFYNRDGQLAFNGGITSSRGHEGDSQGKLKLMAILNQESPAYASSETYGCRLKEEVNNS